ncbi:hypothetical protein ACLB2K_006012 [Fragaria x ananassa]
MSTVHLGNLTLSATKLTVFEYHSPYILERNVCLKAPRMTNLYFHTLAVNQIPAVISQSSAAQVENLHLRIVTEKILVMPRCRIQFWNLKELELTVESIDINEGLDVLLVFSFLKASPLLQKLKFREVRRLSSARGVSQKAEESESRRELPQEYFSHDQLKEVEIVGCEGNWCEIEFAIYMMQRAQCLDKLVFNPFLGHHRADMDWDKSVIKGYDQTKSGRYWQKSGREIVREKLQAKVPASVEQVLL